MSVASATRVATVEPAEASKAVVRRALALLFTEREPRELSELNMPGFRYHEPRMELAGIHGARRICERYMAGFSEATFEVTSMEATEERVTTHLKLRGRHTGAYEGHEPTGQVIEARCLLVHRMEDGRIAEAWAVLRWS